MAGNPGPERRVRSARRAIDLLEGPAERHSGLDVLEDRVAHLVGQPAGRAEVRGRDVGHLHPDATDVEGVGPEGCGDAEDLTVALPGHGTGLGEMPADRLDLHGDVDGRVGLGVGDVLGGGPHGGAAGGLLEGHEGGTEAASAEQELPGGDEVGAHVEGPAQIVAGAGEAEELAHVHGPRPYRPPVGAGEARPAQPLVIFSATSLLRASGAGPLNGMWVPSEPNHSGCSEATAFQSARTAFL